MSWTTALDDLRTSLSDGPTDKLRWAKEVAGFPNGTNKNFKTWEKRRLTNLTTATSPLGVFVNGSAVTVDSDDPATGVFALHAAPAEGAKIEATYYVQWFIDSQLQAYLKQASFFLGYGADYTSVPELLQPAALKYAAADAYQELAVRFAEPTSLGFRQEDLPKEDLKNVIDGYVKLSALFRKDAGELRKGYYTRQNKGDEAHSASISGNARNTEPNR